MSFWHGSPQASTCNESRTTQEMMMWTVHCALRSGRVTGYADRYAEVTYE
jgi:hypothetical protein